LTVARALREMKCFGDGKVRWSGRAKLVPHPVSSFEARKTDMI